MKERFNCDSSWQLYINEVRNIALLSADEERMLFVKMQNGDNEAKNKLIESNLKLVISIAYKYRKHGLSMMDLIQEGNLGLVRAVETYDLSYHTKLSTYAAKIIENSIIEALRNYSNVIRVPSSAYNEFYKYQSV